MRIIAMFTNVSLNISYVLCLQYMSVPDSAFITILVHFLTPCSTVLLEKLTVPKLVKKFRTFYGNRKFITVFTRACHLSLFWSASIQPPPHSTSRSSKSTRTLIRIQRNGVRQFRSGFLLWGARGVMFFRPAGASRWAVGKVSVLRGMVLFSS